MSDGGLNFSLSLWPHLVFKISQGVGWISASILQGRVQPWWSSGEWAAFHFIREKTVSERLSNCPDLHSCSCSWKSPRSSQLQSPCSKALAVDANDSKPRRPQTGPSVQYGHQQSSCRDDLLRQPKPSSLGLILWVARTWASKWGWPWGQHGPGWEGFECYGKELEPWLENNGSQQSVCIAVTKATG